MASKEKKGAHMAFHETKRARKMPQTRNPHDKIPKTMPSFLNSKISASLSRAHHASSALPTGGIALLLGVRRLQNQPPPPMIP